MVPQATTTQIGAQHILELVPSMPKKLSTLTLRPMGGTPAVIPLHTQNSGFEVPTTPGGSHNIQNPPEEAIDLEVRKLLPHNTRRAENRRLQKDLEEQVRCVQEFGGAPIIQLSIIFGRRGLSVAHQMACRK